MGGLFVIRTKKRKIDNEKNANKFKLIQNTNNRKGVLISNKHVKDCKHFLFSSGAL